MKKMTAGIIAVAWLPLAALAQETTVEAAPPPAVEGAIAVPQAAPQEPLPAEAAQGADRIDEVMVTAQKTRQSARSVPISMSVLSEKFIAEHGIVDVVQAMQFVPNVKIASAGFFAAPQARGFSFNNNNKAFESPLGIAFDGIPYTNTTYFNAGLFDVDRVEVLRGPQGTTFGKNTTAGLVSVVTADPASEFSGFGTVQYGEQGRRHVTAAVSGPLIGDAVDFRIAGVYDEHGGFVHNTTARLSPEASGELRGYEHKGWRAKLRFNDLLGSRLKLQYESVTMDSLGAGIELWHATDGVKQVIRKYDPQADFELGNYVNSEDGPDFRVAKVDTALAEWTIPVGEWEATVLGGRSVLEETLGVDVDFSAIPGLNGHSGDKFPTTSLEVRAQSPEIDGLFGLNGVFGLDLGHTEFLGGVFWQKREIKDSYFRFALNDVPFLELTAASLVPPGQPVPDILGTTLNFAGTIVNPLELLLKQEVFNQQFDQDSEVLALFQQTQWAFAERWVLQAGVRVSKETKTGYWDLDFESAEPNALLPLIGLQEFAATRELTETQVQPKLSLNWKPTERVSLFAHWTRGFKGGGFNAFAYREDDGELQFRSETTTEWGLDMKASFLGGTLRPNVSLYRMDAQDFQVLGRQKPPVIAGTGAIPPTCAASTACIPPQVLGLGTTRVFNAPKAYAQGVEADLNWLAFDGFSLLATLGYNDTKFVEFPQNECPASDPKTYCDASGRPFPFAPRWDATLTPGYLFRLGWGLTLTPTLTAQYTSSQILDTDVEEAKRQKGYVRYAATISLASADRGWTVQVIGKNLTDERTSLRYGDVVKNNFLAVPEAAREIFAQLRWNF